MKWIKKLILKWRMRRAMKHTVFHPILTEPRKPITMEELLKSPKYRCPENVVAKAREMGRTAEIMDEFAEITPEGNKLFDGIQSRLKPAVGPITEHTKYQPGSPPP